MGVIKQEMPVSRFLESFKRQNGTGTYLQLRIMAKLAQFGEQLLIASTALLAFVFSLFAVFLRQKWTPRMGGKTRKESPRGFKLLERVPSGLHILTENFRTVLRDGDTALMFASTKLAKDFQSLRFVFELGRAAWKLSNY